MSRFRAAWLLALAALPAAAAALDVAPLWNFADPAASEVRLRDALAMAAEGDDRLSLRTQIARTLSLRGRFADAHAELDAIEPQLAGAGAEPRVRHLLERGRTFRSARQPERARPLFAEAVDVARAARLDDLTVDAMHMVALVEPTPARQLAWNEQALSLARASAVPAARRWQAPLLNNIGWTLADAGRHADALPVFEDAVAVRQAGGTPAALHEARWAVARTLRALGRRAEALALLRELDRDDPADGWVLKEIGENLLEDGGAEAARSWFARAHRALATDASPDRPSAEELARLERLAR